MKTRDNAAIVSMAYRYNDYLVSFAQRYVTSREDAEDIVQDTYLTLMERATISPEDVRSESFGQYLRNMVYWMFRSRKRTPATADEADTERIADTAAALSREDREFAEAVRDEAIKAVPRQCRQAVMMWLEGMNYLQIASRTEKGGSYENARAKVVRCMPLFTRRARQVAAAGI